MDKEMCVMMISMEMDTKILFTSSMNQTISIDQQCQLNKNLLTQQIDAMMTQQKSQVASQAIT